MNGKVSLNPSATKLRVAGLARLSTCDWPGELVATVFCQGCVWDCAYCHNPTLRPAQGESSISWPEVFSFVESRRGLLDGVVFSGGEPTLQPALLDAAKAVRSLGFRIGLHTAGMEPERFEALLPWIDWVGFDVKAPFSVYSRITGVEQSGDKALASLRLLLASGIQYEVRTTFHPALLTLADMLELRDQLLALGVTRYVIQRFRSTGTRTGRLSPLPEQQQLDLPSNYGNSFLQFIVR
jgi:pyruvate formate lyase activating enzyme